MAIESITGRTRVQHAAKTAPTSAIGGESSAAKRSEKADSIAINGMAQGIKKAFASSSSDSIVDVGKVESVKQALADGSYQVNAERIAEKMLQFER